MDKIKLAIAGFGRIVELMHVPMIHGLEEFEISGVYDITPNRREMAGKRKFRVFETYAELLKSDCQMVLIATPPNSHCELASRALENGKNVLIEKPITLDLAEAEGLKELSLKHGGFVSVFQNRRFTPDYKLVRKVLAENLLGTVSFIERRHHSFGAPVWFGVKAFDPYWRVKPEMGGGALMDWGVHLIDQFVDLRLGEVEKVLSTAASLPGAEGLTEDYVHIFLTLSSGLLYTINVNFRSDAADPLWVIGGEKQTLVIKSEKEAVLMEKGKVVQQLDMEHAGRKDGQEIYQSCASYLLANGKLTVTVDEAIEVLRIIEKVKEGW